MRLVLVSKVLYKLYHFPVTGQNLATAAERLSSIVLVKHYDLGALQETWLFPWDLAVPSTLGIDVILSHYRPLMSLMGSDQDIHI